MSLLVISHVHPVDRQTKVLIRLGYSVAPLRDRMLQFFLLLLVAMPIGLVIAGFAGYNIARRAFLPLEEMAARAEQITASNLQERVAVENEHDELGHMARILNHLLQRLEQAFAQLQRFTADAATSNSGRRWLLSVLPVRSRFRRLRTTKAIVKPSAACSKRQCASTRRSRDF